MIEVVDQFMETGIDILNIQDRVNGVNAITNACKGRVCIDLDITGSISHPLEPLGT